MEKGEDDQMLSKALIALEVLQQFRHNMVSEVETLRTSAYLLERIHKDRSLDDKEKRLFEAMNHSIERLYVEISNLRGLTTVSAEKKPADLVLIVKQAISTLKHQS